MYRKTAPDRAELALQPTNEEPLPATWELTFTGPGRGAVRIAWIYGVQDFGSFELHERVCPPLVNVSNRTHVSDGRRVITGFVIDGTTNRVVLIRVLGHSLAAFGVPAPLPHPRFDVYNTSGERMLGCVNWHVGLDYPWQLLGQGKAQWQYAPPQTTTLVTKLMGAIPLPPASPGHPAEPALVVELPPGAYTVHAQAALPGESGEILTEVFGFR